jgi:signal transduction histidine kinase
MTTVVWARSARSAAGMSSNGSLSAVDEVRLQRLLDVGRSLVGVLDLEVVLQRLLEVARQLTGARYAAIGVLDASREGLERFVTAGISERDGHAIGDPPRGRGVLGVLIKEPRPLRLRDVSAHPDSYGFPASHPPMHAFLGVPIVIESRAWGNLYLTEKADGAEFTAGDEAAAVVLADFAAIAIDHARLFRVLETTAEVGRALGGETDLGRVLELVSERARTLLRADAAQLVLAGEDASRGAPALSAPLTFRNRPLGELRVWGGPFGEDAERLLQALAASAAIAVATAQNAAEEALRRSLDASEAERSRWARELHDETLQQLAGLRMLLAGARRSGDRERIDAALEAALEQLSTGIGDLRSLIADLRPAALDELGIAPALETLAGRMSDVEVDLDVTLAARPSAELESTIYRVVQEALTNVAKHAVASRVLVRVHDGDGVIEVLVRDDGTGFDPHRRSTGFGLVGMRERLALVRGTLEVRTAPGGGTTLRASIPHP